MKPGISLIKTGFTLIEVVVVVGVVSIILLVTSDILVSSLRSTTRTESTSQLEGAGTAVMDAVKINVLRAAPGTLVCPIGLGSSFSFTDKDDNQVTSISCAENDQIASNSANPMRLTPDTIHVSGCGNFVSNCDPTHVEINFTLSMSNNGTVENVYSRNFSTQVTLRQ